MPVGYDEELRLRAYSHQSISVQSEIPSLLNLMQWIEGLAKVSDLRVRRGRPQSAVQCLMLSRRTLTYQTLLPSGTKKWTFGNFALSRSIVG